ncbi:MAG: ParB/RepB/Spo0J family partition protein [Alphaproteobacteria bacterium]|jgi:ParB family transcriptional regulator, chromosome partitioning protein|nr:ParB/RepB/Spo0J family partition protein [Alphaproteobacteria bacterium]MBT5827349.1 ParB/RepB/Spo0J family partition protein [Alphaproteobacteria bacterium]
MNNMNLGKGLSELLGAELSSKDFDYQIQEIKLANIEAGKFQPRNSINKNELNSLAESIQEKGVLQPILVKFDDITQKYIIIAGERRFQASRQVGLNSVPALILDVSDQEAYEIALIENIQREKLNYIEEAQAIEKLIREYSYTQEQIAKKLGKSRTYISNMLRLLKLPEEIKNLLINDELSMGHARTLINSSNPLELAKEIMSNNLSVREAEELVKKSKNKKLVKTSQYDTQKQIYLDNIAAELSKLTELKVKIRHKNNKGRFLIEFSNNQQMDYIIEIFESLQQSIKEHS